MWELRETKSAHQKKNNQTNKQKVEAVVQRCSVKKVFSEIPKNSQEKTCAKVFF